MERGEYLDRDQRTHPKIIPEPKHQGVNEEASEATNESNFWHLLSNQREETCAVFYLAPSEDPGCWEDNGGFISRIIFTLHH